MKPFFKYTFLISLFAFTLSVNASTIDILGVAKNIDTLEYRTIGPGTVCARFSLPDYPLSVYMLSIDLNNPNNFVETFQAAEQVGKTEAMTSAFSRLNSDGHKTLAGVNGNFWIVSGQGQPAELLGVPHSGSVKNAEMISDPNGWNRGRATTAEGLLQEIGFAVIDKNRKMWIDDMGFDGKIIIDGVGEYPISEVNRIRKTDELVFFNNYMGTIATRSDDNGTEVFIKPITGQTWSINNDVTCEVVRISKNKGANIIPAGESVLSGTGAAQIFLDNLTVGQTVKINMGVYTLKDKERPQVDEMITGNALVMKNGELTIRNTNEAYNSQLYPRTGVGMSQDGKKLFLIVIDKYAGSIGASTTTMCGILKACGAYNATSLDGGGSAQMMIDAKIVNKPADGKERAVANGWFVYHNTPHDNVITKLEFADYKIEIPFFASYKPVILGYNQYDVLVDKNVQGCVLSCDDSIGQINNEGYFVANDNSTLGLITANLNGLSVTKTVKVIASNINFKLDSVLLDQRREYPVEVLSAVGANVMLIAPNTLEWTVENPAICEIKQGVLKGLSNGFTKVIGRLGDFKDTLNVKVQTHETAIFVQDDFMNTDGWALSSSLSSWNTAFKPEDLPLNWNSGIAVNYTYQSARAPFIKLSRTMPLYSLPDTVRIVVNTGNTEISNLIVAFHPGNMSQTTISFNAIEKNKDVELSIPVSKIVTDPADLINYPIWFDYINFYILASSQTAGLNYNLFIKDISLVYAGMSINSVYSPTLQLTQASPNPVYGDELNIQLQHSAESVKYSVFNLTGQKLRDGNVSSLTDNKFIISTQNWAKGIYILKMTYNGQQDCLKIIRN